MTSETISDLRQCWPILARVQPKDPATVVVAMVRADSAEDALNIASVYYSGLQLAYRWGTLYVHNPINA